MSKYTIQFKSRKELKKELDNIINSTGWSLIINAFRNRVKNIRNKDSRLAHEKLLKKLYNHFLDDTIKNQNLVKAYYSK